MERQLRQWSGLLIALYVLPHLVNQGLGVFEFEAMEAMRRVMSAIWRSVPGTVLLYGAFLIHFLLGLWSLFRRSHLRMPAWEAVQLVLGLLIWPLLLAHAAATRLAYEILALDTTFPLVVAGIWSSAAWVTIKQISLLLVVWGHLAVSLHYWLRLKPWYPGWVPYLYGLSLLIPTFAILGFARATMTVSNLAAADPGWMDRLFAARLAAPAHLDSLLANLEEAILVVLIGLIGLVMAARLARRAYRNRHGTYRLIMPGGRSLSAPVGQTILETIRGAGIAHAAVCGGRGRCTTCRVGVGDGLDDLPPPEAVESLALARIGATPDVRLACQARPRRDLTVTPLLPPSATAREGRRTGGVRGREQRVVILFADLRASTRLGEEKMPYDVLFILNQFFAELAAALEATQGHYAQFNGDGLMALYGLESGVEAGAHQALEGAAQMLSRLDSLNRTIGGELREPLRMGIGIHEGEAIVGTMGPPSSPIFSAIGDNVNIAARLEARTKDLGVPLVVSAAVAAAAEIDTATWTRHQVPVSGRAELVVIYAVPEAAAKALSPG